MLRCMGAHPPAPSCSSFPSLSPHNPLTHSASARAAEFPEDDAKRAAEQLKGIIHDTDGATCGSRCCSRSLPLSLILSLVRRPAMLTQPVADRSAQAKLASRLFDSRRGMVRFLVATTDPENSQDRSKCREHVLKGMAEFVDRAGPRCEEASAEIFLACFKIFKVDQTNSVKQAALEPMKAVLRHQYPRLQEAMRAKSVENEMEKMLDWMIKDFKIGKKATHTQTLKGHMLELMGIWAKSYPEVVHNAAYSAVTELKQLCMNTLQIQFEQWDRHHRHGGTKPDWLLMYGAILLLSGLCTVHKLAGAAGRPFSFRVDHKELFKWFAYTLSRSAPQPLHPWLCMLHVR